MKKLYEDDMADIIIEKDGNREILIISGELTIGCAEELKNILEQILENADHAVLDMGNITGIDLSGLQFLCSAHRTSLHMKKSLELKADYPEVLKQAVEEAGYLSRYPVCSPGNSLNCFWMEISKEILCRA